jgi:hypothetical protein
MSPLLELLEDHAWLGREALPPFEEFLRGGNAPPAEAPPTEINSSHSLHLMFLPLRRSGTWYLTPHRGQVTGIGIGASREFIEIVKTEVLVESARNLIQPSTPEQA